MDSIFSTALKWFPDYICHYNTWWWGITLTLVHNKGIATVELQFDNEYPNVAFIKGISVVPDSRTKGYGTQMMELCEKLAKDAGMKMLQLAAEKENNWLVQWYNKCGFVIYGLSEHEYVMIKNIA